MLVPLKINPFSHGLPWDSAEQQAWRASARQTFDALGEAGGFVKGFRFLALDERLPARMLRSAWHALGVGPPDPYLAHCLDGGIARVCSAGSGGVLLNILSRVLGTTELARRFVCAHEWAHAWHEQAGRPLACAGVRSGSWSQPCATGRLAWELNKCTEEAFCDATACFTLRLMGEPDALARMAAFRKVSAALGASASTHHNHKALLACAHAVDSCQDFESFAGACTKIALTVSAPIPTFFFEALSARYLHRSKRLAV